MNDDFIASARGNNAPRVKYRSLEDRKFENTFNPNSVVRQIPKIEKEIDKKTKKKKSDFVRSKRPPAEKVEYICAHCGRGEERYRSAAFDMQETYICRNCTKGGSRRRSK